MMQRTLPPVRGPLTALVFLLPIATAAAEETLQPVNVTAARMPQTADETLAAVSVINRAAIQSSQAQSLPDLLVNQRGVSIARNGGRGKSTSLFMRGTNSDHVLVLVDGVQIGSATLGTTAFQHLPLEQVERIEIVRGPRSSLYGSEAIGGVIQIFMRKGEAGETRVNTSAMGGSNSSSEITTAISGGDEDTRYALSAKAFDTNGIDARDDGFPDDDGYENDSASFRLEHDFGDSTTWSIRAQQADGITEFDNCGEFSNPLQDCEDEFRQQAVSTRLDSQLTERWSIRLNLGETLDESTLLTDGVFDSEFNTRREEFTWQNQIAIGQDHLLTAGFDYSDERVSGSTAFDRNERDNQAVFGQWQWTGEQTDVAVSARRDDHETFGEETTGSVAAGYRLQSGLRIYGSLGNAFKAPTFNDLFFPDSPFFQSNPNLDPEESTSAELGIEGGRAWRWSANLFFTEIDDIIVFDASAATVNNLNTADIAGLELAGSGNYADWDIQTSLTLLDTEIDTSGANDGNDLPRRPEATLNLDFSRTFGAVELGTHLRYEAERYDDVANQDELDDFTLVGLRLDYTMRDNLHLEVSVDNLFDEDYQSIRNFDELGHTGYIRLRYDL